MAVSSRRNEGVAAPRAPIGAVVSEAVSGSRGTLRSPRPATNGAKPGPRQAGVDVGIRDLAPLERRAGEVDRQDCRRRLDEKSFCQTCGVIFDESFMPLMDLKVGARDKLNNTVIEILWASRDFKIYRTRAGVFVHMSDCGHVADKQKSLFYRLHPRLCQMRFLTSCIDRSMAARLRRLLGFDRCNFFHQETARAIVQALHDRCEHARGMLDFVTDMALEHVTNENRVRYLIACLAVAVAFGLGIDSLLWLWDYPPHAVPYAAASAFGAVGAVFSIATNVGSLALVPSRHSMMNYVMGGLRVLTGLMGGGLLLLAFKSGVVGDFGSALAVDGTLSWERAAMLGFLAGFAERLVPNMMGGAAEQMAAYRRADKGDAHEAGEPIREASGRP